MSNFEELQAKDQATLDALRKKYYEMGRQISKVFNRMKKRQEQEDAKIIQKGFATLEEQIEYFLYEDGSVDGIRYKEREKFFEGLGLMVSGYFTDAEQSCIQFKVERGQPLDPLIKSLQTILPHIKPASGDRRVFDILEHALSQGGIYQLHYDGAVWHINKQAYGNCEDEASFSDLKSALQYIQTYLYYE